MSRLWEVDRRLYVLLWYSRNIGLPSLLLASLIASFSVGMFLLVEAASFIPILTIIAQAMLVFMAVDAALIPLNLWMMLKHLNRILSSLRKKGLPYDSLVGVEDIQETLREKFYTLSSSYCHQFFP